MLRLSDSSRTSNFNEIEPQKGLQIKQDNKFFSRLMSKETFMSNSPSMVYYGGASGAIPFMWESHPGTPKHLSSDAALPPLTPPPSYHHHSSSFMSNPKQKPKPKPMPKWSLKPNLFGSIFRKLITPRRNNDSPLSSYSHSSSPSWSSYYGSGSSFSSVSSFMNRNVHHRRRGYFSCSRSPVHNCMYDDDDDDDLHESSRSCFGVKVKPMNLKEFRGCRSVVNMKKALMSFVNQD